MVNFVQFARAAPCTSEYRIRKITAYPYTNDATEPVMLFSVVAIMISFIFTTVIVTSGTKVSSRNFYLVSFEYNLNTGSSSSLTKRSNNETHASVTSTVTPTSTIMSGTSSIASAQPTSSSVADVQAASKSKFRDAVKQLQMADEINSNMTFSQVRVSYHGVCTQVAANGTKDDSWRCGDVKSTRSLAQMTGGDPFDLIDIGAYYKDKMAFSLPWWFAVGCLGISTIALVLGSIPLMPATLTINRVAAATAVLGNGSLLVGLVLAHVTSNAVVTLTDLLTVDTVTAHIGRMNQTFGWTAFALSFLAALGISFIVLGEYALITAERRANATIDHTINKGMERLPFSSPVQHVGLGSAPGSQRSGLGRTMGGVTVDDFKDLTKAKSRGEALAMVAGKISTKRNDNMV